MLELGKSLAVDWQRGQQIARAMRKTGRSVVVVPVRGELHAGKIAVIRAARTVPGSVLMIANFADAEIADSESGAVEGVDFVVNCDSAGMSLGEGLEPRVGEVVADDIRAAIGLSANDLFLGERDFERVAMANRICAGLATGIRVHSVPTVRLANGLAMSSENLNIAESDRDAALVLSAALLAGAHIAEKGSDAVLEAVRTVLDDEPRIAVEYLELRGLDMGPAPEQGDARLLVAAQLGSARLTDSVGLPLGIGFKGIEG